MKFWKWEIVRVRKTNILHPDYKSLCEFAFEIDGVQYYQFKNSLDMPARRRASLDQFIREAQMRVTSEDLKDITEEAIRACNKGDLVRTVRLLDDIRTRTILYLETDTFYRMFSCLFFDLKEDITLYDQDYNNLKIERFKRVPKGDFFLMKLTKRWLPDLNISAEDIEVFSLQTEAAKEYSQKIRQSGT